jgi:glycerol-3-phosphate dehydrogenase (NAD(P)+)
MMGECVTILGHGAMATVAAGLLVENGHAVTMWGAHPVSVERLRLNRDNGRLLPGARIPDAVRLTADDADAFAGVTLVVSSIPTQYMRSTWQRLAPYLPADVPVVSVAKGIEVETLLTPTHVVADVLGDRTPPLAVLSGPNIAAEIVARQPATAVAASADAALGRRVQAAFNAVAFRVYTNPDVVGVELAGAVKNVIALAAGMLDGIGAGDNAKAALVTRGLVEITRLGVAMGAEEGTFTGLAGLGDLITTCVSPRGRNRSVGEQLSRGRPLAAVLESTDSVAEGVPTTRSVVRLARRLGVEMPITEAVHAVLFEGRDPRAALADLMSRDPKPERRD